MDNNKMIDDLVKMLDSGISKGVGHVNVQVDDATATSATVETHQCNECSRTPLACSIPTLEQ